MALTKVSGEVITRPLILTGNSSVTGIMTVGIGSTTTTIDGSQDFPTIRPTLDLNFAATKTLDRRITFTRDSIGTYTDEFGIVKYASNNVPRFDHDPETGESLGLLIEESRTNTVTRSEDWTVGWIDTDVTDTANAATAPDGTDTATKIVADNTNAEHFTQFPSLTSSINTYYTYSVFCKSAELSSVAINVSASRLYATFNLATGSIITSNSNGTDFNNHSATITSYPNGWFRLTLTGQSLRNTSSEYVRVVLSNSSTNILNSGGIWQGDGTSGLYFWGAQYEQGSFPTSYIPTSGSTVTRNKDIAKITGTNFTGFYNTLEGTLYSSFIRKPASNRFFVGLGYDSSNYIAMGYTVSPGNDMYIQPLISSLNGLTSVGGNVRSKSIISYNSSGASGCINGNSVVSETASGGLPSGSNGALYVGSSPYDPPNICTGTISSVVYYPKRLTNAQLQSLTRQ